MVHNSQASAGSTVATACQGRTRTRSRGGYLFGVNSIPAQVGLGPRERTEVMTSITSAWTSQVAADQFDHMFKGRLLELALRTTGRRKALPSDRPTTRARPTFCWLPIAPVDPLPRGTAAPTPGPCGDAGRAERWRWPACAQFLRLGAESANMGQRITCHFGRPSLHSWAAGDISF